MKSFYPLLLLLAICMSGIALIPHGTQPVPGSNTLEPHCITIKAGPGNYKQLNLDSRGAYQSDTTGPEIVSAAWTCNAQGDPVCNFRALFKYNVSSVPANAVITSAKLYLYAKTNAINGYYGDPTYGSNNTSLLQRVTTPWTVSGTGWANQPATTTSSQKILAQSTSTRQNYIVDVTDFAQYWVSQPDSNYGMILRLQTEDYYNSMIFNSSQAPDSLKPRLEICYTTGPTPPADSCYAGIKDSTWETHPMDHVFIPQLSHDNHKKPKQICWDFADGTNTCIQYDSTYAGDYSISHIFKIPGSYPVCVLITYTDNCVAQACKTVQAYPTVQDSCHVEITDSTYTGYPLSRLFYASTQHSSNKKPVEICWNFGDGQDTCIDYDSSYWGGYWIEHLYNAPGVYTVCATVTYEGGCESQACKTIQVKDTTTPAPVCNNQLVIRGNPIDGRFKQLNLDLRGDYQSDSSQPEMVTAAWTCNAQGAPICNFRALFKYNVSSIPANAVIKSAKLYLYAKTNAINGNYGNPTYGTNNTSLLQRVVTPWTVGGTGWANQPTTTTTSQKVLPQSTHTRQNYVVEVTDFVQYWVNKPDSNYGALLRLQTEQYYNSMIFNSGQAPDSLKPRLEICYEVPGPGNAVCYTSFTDSVTQNNPLSKLFIPSLLHSGNKKPAQICWDFGDGHDTCINYSNTNNNYSISHTYATHGNYHVCVTVKYEGGCEASKCRNIYVFGTPSRPVDSSRVVVKLYTNPTTGPLLAWVSTREAARGDAMLYDQQGNLKQVLKPSIHFLPGINLVYMQINRVRVPAGSYFVKIRVRDTVRSFKIVVL